MAVAFDAVGPSSSGTNSSTTPLTWSHTCAVDATAIVVGVTSFDTGSNLVTSVTYGGVSCSLLGYHQSGTGGAEGGFALYYLDANGGLPTGTNTVSVAFTNGADTIGGSVSFTGSDGHGTVVSAESSSTSSTSVTVDGTTAGGMIAAGTCFGGDGGGGTFSGTNGVTAGWQKSVSTNSGSDNAVSGTVASTGGGANQTVGFSSNAPGADDWGIVAVELLPAATWTVLQSSGNTASSSGTVAASYTDNLTANTKLIAVVTTAGNSTASTVEDGAGNPFTKLAYKALNNTSADGELSLWARDTPAGDVGIKPTITATLSATSNSAIVIQEVSGLLPGNTSAMLDGTAGLNSGTISVNGNVTCGAYSSTAASEYLIALYGDNEASSDTAGTPTGAATYTLDSNSQQANSIADAVIAYGNSTDGAETATFAISGPVTVNDWATILVAFGLGSPAGSPAVTTSSLPSGTVGLAYSATLQATGGITPYAWSISSGSLPGWASLNTSTGVISGTVSGSPAVTSFTVEVTDNDGYTGTQPLSITTVPLLNLNLQSAIPGIPAPGLFVPGRLITPPSGAKPLQDSPQVNPGLAWLSHFKPGLRKPRPWLPAVSAGLAPVTCSGSFSLAPLAFTKLASPVVLQSALSPSGTSGRSTATATFGSNASARSTMIAAVAIGNNNGTTVTSVQDAAGNNFIKVATASGIASFYTDVELWALNTPAGDAGIKPAITVNISNSTGLSVLVQEVSGITASITGAGFTDGAAGTLFSTYANGATVIPAASYSSSVAREYLISVYGDQGPSPGANLVAPAGYTLDPNSYFSGSGSLWAQLAIAYRLSTGGVEAGSFNATSSSATPYGSIVTAFKGVIVAGQGSVSQWDTPKVNPGEFWLQLFKPQLPKPFRISPEIGQVPAVTVTSTGSFSLASLAFAANGNQTSPDVTQIQPGPFWFQLFKPDQPKPFRPLWQGLQAVNATGSFTLAPLKFAASGAQSSPDVTQITPGTTWLSLFKPWIQKPQPVPPAFQSANATASFTLASLVFQGQGSQTSPDVPQVNPGAAWLSLFKHKPLPQDLPAQPPANLVTTTGSFTLAPLAFQAQGSQTAPDQLQVQPGTTWIRLFRPDLYKPLPPLPAQQSANGTASFTLATLAFSAQGSRTSPDVPQILPGTTWFDLFKPWFPRPRPVPPAFQGVNGTASFALAPLAFAAQGSQTSPDIPQAQPGPVWLRLFKPAQAKPLPWIPSAPFIGVQGEAGFALAPLAFAAQGSATSPDLPQIVPGTTWLSWFKHRQRPVVPVLGPVAASGSLSLAPLAFLAQGNQTSPDVPQVDPGAFWLRLFKPWVQKPVPPLPARDQVSTSGSLSLASLRLAAHGAQTSPDVPQISPGTTWLSLFKRKPRPIVPAFQGIGGAGGVTLAPLTFTASGSVSLVPGNFLQVNPGPGWLARFKHWQRPLRPDALPTHVNATGRITLGTLAFLGKGPSTPATIALGVPYFQWITGNPQLNWRIL